jgi:hypothetical protein
MVKRKRQTIQWSSEKGQNDKMHRKLKIEQHEPHKNVGEFRCSKLDIYVFLLLCKFQEISWLWYIHIKVLVVINCQLMTNYTT